MRQSRKAITRRATVTSAAGGFHDTPKIGLLMPVRWLAISQNFTAERLPSEGAFEVVIDELLHLAQQELDHPLAGHEGFRTPSAPDATSGPDWCIAR